MTVAPNTFADSLASLSITVTKPDGTTGTLEIRDLDDVGPVIYARDCPILYPQYEYQTGFSSERLSMGTDPFRETNWTANYYYAHAPIGAGRYGNEHASKISANVKAICDGILAGLSTLGVNDVEISGASEPTLVPGPDDETFHGATIAIAVNDFRNQT